MRKWSGSVVSVVHSSEAGELGPSLSTARRRNDQGSVVTSEARVAVLVQATSSYCSELGLLKLDKLSQCAGVSQCYPANEKYLRDRVAVKVNLLPRPLLDIGNSFSLING